MLTLNFRSFRPENVMINLEGNLCLTTLYDNEDITFYKADPAFLGIIPLFKQKIYNNLTTINTPYFFQTNFVSSGNHSYHTTTRSFVERLL